MSTEYRVTLTRCGRGAPPEPFAVSGEDADELAFHIFVVARRRLLSRDVNVTVDLDSNTVNVYAGFQHVGEGTIERVSP